MGPSAGGPEALKSTTKTVVWRRGRKGRPQTTRKPVLLRPRKTHEIDEMVVAALKPDNKTASRNERGAKKQGLYRNASSRRKTHKNEKRASNRHQNDKKMMISCQENASNRS